MNCRKVYKNLSAYHDKLLSGEKARQLEQHLRECPECMQKWREFSEIVKAAGYLEVRKPSSGFNQHLLEKVSLLGAADQESYEPSGNKRWPAYALVLAGMAVAFMVFLTFPHLKKGESHSLAQAPNQTPTLYDELELDGRTFTYQVSEDNDSLWQLFEFENTDDFGTFNPETFRREAKVYRRYVLPVVGIEAGNSYAGESYLFTPVASSGTQSTDVVF